MVRPEPPQDVNWQVTAGFRSATPPPGMVREWFTARLRAAATATNLEKLAAASIGVGVADDGAAARRDLAASQAAGAPPARPGQCAGVTGAGHGWCWQHPRPVPTPVLAEPSDEHVPVAGDVLAWRIIWLGGEDRR